MRAEVVEIAREYGSTVRTGRDFGTVEIIPPVPNDQVDKLARALVDLANRLDPTAAPATYDFYEDE